MRPSYIQNRDRSGAGRAATMNAFSDEALTWDFTNLCLHRPPRAELVGLRPLYPTEEEVSQSSVSELSVDEIFELADRRPQVQQETSLQSRSERLCDENAPEEFKRLALMRPSTQSGFAPLERQVEVRTSVEECRKGCTNGAQSFTETTLEESSIETSPFYGANDANDSATSLHLSSSSLQFNNDTTTGGSYPQCYNEHASHSRYLTSHLTSRAPDIAVEVTPGHFMPLRGSEETMRAIESGRAHVVECMACGAVLTCVPDCELVICPDCRVLSPVLSQPPDVSFAHSDPNHNSVPAIPTYWWDEDRPVGLVSHTSPTRRVSLPLQRRGVGLGLRIG